MPKIPPTASPWGLDWNTLPKELKLDISDRVRPDVRAQLTEVSAPWRHAAMDASFERRARAFIAKRENVSPDDLPTPFGGGEAGEALRAKGLPHAAMVSDLFATCERLPAVDTALAVCSTLPDLALGPGSVFLPRRGESVFVAHGGENGDLQLLSTDGTRRAPLALAGRDLAITRLSVTGSLLSPSHLDDTTLVCDRNGAVNLFDSTSDELRPLPNGLRRTHPGFAAHCQSRSGRYVAMSDWRENKTLLRVYDRSTVRLVTDTVMPPHSDTPQPISVDDDGTLLILGPSPFELKPGQRASDVKAMRLDGGFVAFGLSPDNRHLVLHNPKTGVIVLEDRHDGRRTTLQPPVDQGERSANTIAFSPAMAMAAVLYDNGGLAIFDLLNAAADMHTLQPRLHMPLEHGRMFRGNAAAWFDPDAGGIHVAHPLSKRPSPHRFPGTALVHLRFD